MIAKFNRYSEVWMAAYCKIKLCFNLKLKLKSVLGLIWNWSSKKFPLVPARTLAIFCYKNISKLIHWTYWKAYVEPYFFRASMNKASFAGGLLLNRYWWLVFMKSSCWNEKRVKDKILKKISISMDNLMWKGSVQSPLPFIIQEVIDFVSRKMRGGLPLGASIWWRFATNDDWSAVELMKLNTVCFFVLLPYDQFFYCSLYPQ